MQVIEDTQVSRAAAIKLPPGVWSRGGKLYVRFTCKGRAVNRSTDLAATKGNVKAAVRLLADLRFRARNGLLIDGPGGCSVRLGELLSKWEKEQTTTGWRANAIAIRRLVEHFGAEAWPKDISTSERVAGFARWRRTHETRFGRPPKRKVIMREVFVLKAALAWGAGNRWWSSTDVAFNLPDWEEEADLPCENAGKYHEAAEVDAFFAVCDVRVRAVMTFARYTAARHTELLRLRPNQIERTPDGAAPGQVTLVETKTKQPRTVALNAKALEAVEIGLSYMGETVFPWPNISQLAGTDNERHRRGKAPMTVRDMRHIMATDLWRKTKDIEAVQYQLGHARLSTTLRYLHLNAPKLREETAAYVASL